MSKAGETALSCASQSMHSKVVELLERNASYVDKWPVGSSTLDAVRDDASKGIVEGLQ